MNAGDAKSVGLIGARGYVGSEMLALIAGHPRLKLGYASSRALAGQTIPGAGHGQVFEILDPRTAAARAADVCILALPNGLARDYVTTLDAPGRVLVDVSADYRFDPHWAYGLPEIYPVTEGTQRISNPGCYATAMQLALAPLVGLVDGAPVCFGVSGYSGAGTTPSDKNNPELLKDSLMPYSPIGHVHEREVARHLGVPIHFVPHVAPFFRGIAMTVNATLTEPLTNARLTTLYDEYYAGRPLVCVSAAIPRVAENVGRHHAAVGGWQVSADGRRVVVFATLDNLLKGAATQALQNINLACGFPELEGIADGVSVAEQTA